MIELAWSIAVTLAAQTQPVPAPETLLCNGNGWPTEIFLTMDRKSGNLLQYQGRKDVVTLKADSRLVQFRVGQEQGGTFGRLDRVTGSLELATFNPTIIIQGSCEPATQKF